MTQSKIEEIIEKLKEVYDPEIPINIYDLGLVYSVDIDEEGVVSILMTLTAPGCPIADQIIMEVHDKAMEVEGVKETHVELTFDPPWDKSMMSEEARLELGFF
ncbi:MAG: iron-sulfur cluster assembly protein [Bacteroidota bacterium]|nr:iron-sulfur cluster assembly protein [Bacteroidota bacterium]MDP4205198.1 iron-sulfur cluster assembly protein [Bacteroidota bacterium]